VKTLAEMQAAMKLFHEEPIALKSGFTSVGINLPNGGTTQLSGIPRGLQEPNNSSKARLKYGQ